MIHTSPISLLHGGDEDEDALEKVWTEIDFVLFLMQSKPSANFISCFFRLHPGGEFGQ